MKDKKHKRLIIGQLILILWGTNLSNYLPWLVETTIYSWYLKLSSTTLFQQRSFCYKAFVCLIDLIVIVMVVALCFILGEDISLRLIERKVRNNVELFFVEINLRKKKWLLCCSYNPHKNSISNYVDVLGRELDVNSSNYENFYC